MILLVVIMMVVVRCRLVDDRIESVVLVSGVVDRSDRTVRLNK